MAIFQMQLRGQIVKVDARILKLKPGREGTVSVLLTDETEKTLDWTLSRAELVAVCTAS